MATSKKFATMDEYIQNCPTGVQPILEKIRQTIRKAAPGAVETISYGIPAFDLNGRHLIYFAGWKEHVSVYPVPSNTEDFQEQIAPYVGGKGTIRLPLNQPIPYDLVEKIVRARMKET